ncbi:hypothetical protein LS68_008025 [Helicobacter sp. MIT 05-5293]|uniref:hypothetical protein n=1 Tax=Helicobacter sp. MIT 05-5293 TaxID=1548149 RepID=UPI00051E0114|nr:hypothetical protein [Helicobacter sp. MIT 05-5293]TLD80155.1 hypothetical protein LS68_008025 [Helicobacter sp. MIT 05-5293]
MSAKYPHIKVRLVGEDGNAFAIMGRVVHAMKKAKVEAKEIEQFKSEAMSGDYDHLLQVVMCYVEVE